MNKQNKTPVVSIVTPSYNQDAFIEETMKSVLGQEGDFYIDYIVVDGGSTDHSVEIIKKYDRLIKEKRWPAKCRGIQYRWISEKDRGQADAINKGFNMAHGETLAWLNSDDTYLTGALSKIMGHINAHPDAGMVYGKSRFINKEGHIIGEYPTEPFNHKRLAIFNFICQPSAFFTRDVFLKAGGLDPDLNYAMDYDLWLRIAVRCKPAYIDEFLSTYRLHAESKSVADLHMLKTNEECLKTVMKYFGWAPPNRVYGYYYYVLKSKMPRNLDKIKPLISFLSILVSAGEYIHLNKGIKLEDIKMLNPHNIKKILKGWESKNILK